MNKEIEQFICPIIAGPDDLCGVGVIVDGILLTAAHVLCISDSRMSTYIEGQEFFLDRKDAIVFACTGEGPDMQMDEKSVDLAAFDIIGITGKKGISLQPTINPSEVCTCITFRVASDRSFPEPYVILECNVTPDSVFGNVLLAHANPILKPGDSGCPLVQGGKVAGILLGGETETDKCAFLTSKVIAELLANLPNK